MIRGADIFISCLRFACVQPCHAFASLTDFRLDRLDAAKELEAFAASGRGAQGSSQGILGRSQARGASCRIAAVQGSAAMITPGGGVLHFICGPMVSTFFLFCLRLACVQFCCGFFVSLIGFRLVFAPVFRHDAAKEFEAVQPGWLGQYLVVIEFTGCLVDFCE